MANTPSNPRRSISEKLDRAIADLKAMAAGEIPLDENLLRWIWTVDIAATRKLEAADQTVPPDELPTVDQFLELMRAMDSNLILKGACLSVWATHITRTAPDPERHYTLVMGVVNELLAEDETLGVAEVIPACINRLHRETLEAGDVPPTDV